MIRKLRGADRHAAIEPRSIIELNEDDGCPSLVFPERADFRWQFFRVADRKNLWSRLQGDNGRRLPRVVEGPLKRRGRAEYGSLNDHLLSDQHVQVLDGRRGSLLAERRQTQEKQSCISHNGFKSSRGRTQRILSVPKVNLRPFPSRSGEGQWTETLGACRHVLFESRHHGDLRSGLAASGTRDSGRNIHGVGPEAGRVFSSGGWRGRRIHGQRDAEDAALA